MRNAGLEEAQARIKIARRNINNFSYVQLFATQWTAAYQAPLSKGFSRQEYWSGLPLPSLIMYSAYKLNKQGDNIQP